MPLIQYVENAARGDNTTSLRFDRDDGSSVELLIGGAPAELTDAEFAQAASMYSVRVVDAADFPPDAGLIQDPEVVAAEALAAENAGAVQAPGEPAPVPADATTSPSDDTSASSDGATTKGSSRSDKSSTGA
jgi:hypothetical protein